MTTWLNFCYINLSTQVCASWFSGLLPSIPKCFAILQCFVRCQPSWILGMLVSNFSKDLASFSKIRSLFPKTQCCCLKATPTLLLQGYFIIFSFPLPGFHFQTMLQMSSKWLFSIKICSGFLCRFLLGIALSTHYGLHTRKEGAERKGLQNGKSNIRGYL